MGRKVDVDDLLDSNAVAALLKLSLPNAVSVYRRRYSDFPAPVVVTGRCMLWTRQDIERWARSRRS